MRPQFIARVCLTSLVLSAALALPAEQPKSDTDAVSEKLQAMERDWLNAEKNHDASAFEKIVADDYKLGVRRSNAPEDHSSKSVEPTSRER